MTSPLNRRAFLLSSIVAGGTAVVGAARSWRVLVDVDRPLPAGATESSLAHVFTHPDRAAEIGRAYLRVAPAAEADQHVLESMVGRTLEPGPLRTAVARRVHDDFEVGRTVEVDGWILSETEARLCAITSFTA